MKDTQENIMVKFKLICDAGIYEADSLTDIVIEVIKHRFWHLKTHGKWMD